MTVVAVFYLLAFDRRKNAFVRVMWEAQQVCTVDTYRSSSGLRPGVR